MKGIIFSGNHVPMILAGKKTQTRRFVVPQPASCQKLCRDAWSPSGYTWYQIL